MPLNCFSPCLLSDYSGKKQKQNQTPNPWDTFVISTFVNVIISQPPIMDSLYFYMSPEEKNDCKKKTDSGHYFYYFFNQNILSFREWIACLMKYCVRFFSILIMIVCFMSLLKEPLYFITFPCAYIYLIKQKQCFRQHVHM